MAIRPTFALVDRVRHKHVVYAINSLVVVSNTLGFVAQVDFQVHLRVSALTVVFLGLLIYIPALEK